MNTLLIVDDESTFAAFVVKVASAAGYRARAAASVSAFHADVETGWPSVLVLDLQMPGTDGIELLREIGERRCPSKVVLISGVDERVLDSAHRLGVEIGLAMAGAVRKPVRATELRQRLAALHGDLGNPTPEALAAAIDSERLFLLYQPKVDVRTRRVVGVEALVRWRGESGRIIPPDAFVPMAETSGLIDRLTAWVVDRAFRQAGAWRGMGLDLQVAVNLSARNIHDRQLPDLLAARCAAAGVTPERLTLELTETASMQDAATLLEILSRFRLKGFRLSIDDFGTGYSSIAQLLRLPFSELKVDKSFVSGMETARELAVIVETTIGMAHNLGLSVVAEGVETEAALRMLGKWNCDLAQGYLFSEPVEAAAIETMAASPAGMG
ncbi:MAG: EAL domain-containing response regulator [Alphaproteobacteria bacterium]|nr:EAL domain-containing response regulator [Alphaproteobacteria bacterium]